METVVNLISTVGFPIVCCFFLWKFVNTTLKENTAVMRELVTAINKRFNMDGGVDDADT